MRRAGNTGGGGAGELNEYINNLLNYKNVFWIVRSTWTSTRLVAGAGAGAGTGADFGHNALNYGLIVHAICCYSYVARRRGRQRGLGTGTGTQMAMELKVGAIIAPSLRRISLGNLIYGIFF